MTTSDMRKLFEMLKSAGYEETAVEGDYENHQVWLGYNQTAEFKFWVNEQKLVGVQVVGQGESLYVTGESR